MAFTIKQTLPDPAELAESLPTGPEHRVDEHRQNIRNIQEGTDPRLLMVVGPCSAWPIPAVEQYAERLARLQEDVRERLFLVLRTYIQKPRTTLGWPGPLAQPDPLAPADIHRGIWECRAMMTKVGKLLPLADEMLFTHNGPYFDDMLSYLALGARSSCDQEHRFIASGLPTPVGVKHPVDGNTEVGVDGVQVVQHPHEFSWEGNHVSTTGNPHAHLILRGGKTGSNYDPQSVALAAHLLQNRGVQHPMIMVDGSHDNCRNGNGKDPTIQAHVVRTVLSAKENAVDGYEYVRGFMLESFLHRGSQKIGPEMTHDGLSITDPCLGWEDTDTLIRATADAVDRMMGHSVHR
ncbi:3-deoxy-7-phosphoheptulonate synthase [Candidatus Peregrinibacteria bacterium CG1_02_54_53]|nr:MAG: 3-deoxy-7-phosphoheptulonate synthase [Candidatus Peregrinibacteria bacterium CG1_02_54_53]